MSDGRQSTQLELLTWQEFSPAAPDLDAPRILVVGDLHQNLEHAEYWSRQECDHIVFLGDYFDGSDDCPEEAARMALWLREQAHNERCTLILGNHDVHYRWPGRDELVYPGFTFEKARAINRVMTAEDWSRFRLASMAGSFLVSHAGFSPIWITPPNLENILRRCQLAEERARAGIIDPVFGYGELRGGLQRFGGPLAMNFESSIPLEGINQIVGHSSSDEVRIRAGKSSVNICVNVGKGAVAALVQGPSIRMIEPKCVAVRSQK